MFKYAPWLLVVAALVVPLGCSSEDDDDSTPAPAPWGPSAIAVGDDGLIMLGSMGGDWTCNTTSTIGTGNGCDIVKVVRIPNSSRFVAIVNRNDVSDVNAEIWYNDNNGEGPWTKGTYGASEANLDAVHVAANVTYGEWDLYDIMFLNSTEGYAVGSNYIILYTADAGVTWTDLNDFQPTGSPNVLYQELTISGAVPAALVPGTTITGGAGASGTIISVNEYYSNDIITVQVTTPGTTAFTTGGDITAPASADITSIDYQDIWKYNTATITCMYGIQGPATTGRGIHTLWFGVGNQIAGAGIWKVVSNDPVGTAARTFTVTGPDLGDQYASGQVGYYDINSLYYFDGTTGCVATDYGIYYTTSTATKPGLDYAMFTGTGSDQYNGFVYSGETNAQDGYLYSISDNTDNQPGRVAVTYTAGATPVWSFGTTPTWTLHATSANYDMYYARYPNLFLSNGKIFSAGTYVWSDGSWAWCGNYTETTFENTLWTDTYQQYLGGTAANGDNPAYNKNVFQTGTTPTSGYLRSFCPR